MSHFLVAITGPAGSGKSTVAEKLAKKLDHCVNIDADHIKHMIVSGFYYDNSNPEDENSWGFNEWSLVGESIGLLAQNFQKHGYDVIINGYIDEPAWESIEKLIPITHKVLLLPSLSTAINRDKERSKELQQGEASIARHHLHFSTDGFFKDFRVIDTTHQLIDDTVDEVNGSIASSI